MANKMVHLLHHSDFHGLLKSKSSEFTDLDFSDPYIVISKTSGLKASCFKNLSQGSGTIRHALALELWAKTQKKMSGLEEYI